MIWVDTLESVDLTIILNFDTEVTKKIFATYLSLLCFGILLITNYIIVCYT